MFDYVTHFSAPTAPCTREAFASILDDPRVAHLNEQAHQERDADRRGQIKRQLPAFCFHAHFTDGRHHAASAVPSGLFLIDLDHIAEMPQLSLTEYYHHKVRHREVELGIVLAHITPSGEGLRVVAVRPMMADGCTPLGIAEAQQWLCRELNVAEMDVKVKDLSRLSFAPSRAQVLYLDEERLFAPLTHVTPVTVVPNEPHVIPENSGSPTKMVNAEPSVNPGNPAPSDTPEADDADPWLEDDGKAANGLLSGFVPRLLLKLGIDGEPMMGERNDTLYTLTRYMRHVCDFNEQQLLSVLPTFGLPQAEVLSTVRSALASPRPTKMPPIMERLLCEVKAERQALEDEAEADIAADTLPRLPRLLQTLVKAYPPEYRPAVVAAALPMLGTLTTHVRALYCDGAEHSTSFITLVMAPQASGKSFVGRLKTLLLAPVAAEDLQQRQIEHTYELACRRARNQKVQPEDPKPVVRLVPPTISNTKLLKRLENAHGLHLFTYAPEVDTMVRSNSAGAWSNKNDILRMTFDNDEWGQDYASETSYSAMVSLYWNHVLCGTPRAVRRLMPDVENGLVSRVILATLPDTLGYGLRRMGAYSVRDQNYIAHEVQTLYEAGLGEKVHYLPKRILSKLEYWLENCRLEFLISQDHPSIVQFSRRAAVNGFRAGLVGMALEGGRETKAAIDLALWVARYTHASLLKHYGKELDKVSLADMSAQQGVPVTRQGRLFEQLPDVFALRDVASQRAAMQLPADPNNLYVIIHRWVVAGMVEKVAKDRWMKVKPVAPVAADDDDEAEGVSVNN